MVFKIKIALINTLWILFGFIKLFICYLVNRGDVITSIAKSLKSPRSAVCKTAIMTSADIFSAYNDRILDSLDPLVS